MFYMLILTWLSCCTVQVLAETEIGLEMNVASDTALTSQTPVLLVQNDWTSQLVLARIVGHILEDSGFPVEYVSFDSQLQFQALADGSAHFQIAAWEGPMVEAFEEGVRIGMVDAGTHTATTREGWWIPQYVLDECPAAANWQGLNDCAHLFNNNETSTTGQFIGPPADWGKNYARRIAALQMNFQLTHVNSEPELWSRLQTAYDARQPIVLFNWTPNFTDVIYDGRFVDFPEPAPACETDAAWGPNPDVTGDCGDRSSNWLKKAAWSGLAQIHPEAWAILKKIDFTNEQIASAIKMVDIDEQLPEEAARLWVTQNARVVEQWQGR